MIKIENIEVIDWKAAIRGMRNPLESWDKSDTVFDSCTTSFSIGKNDLELMQKLVKAGSDHAKFMRFIDVTMDITAPLYWWKQFDTYKVGTVTNSTSTMHCIHKKEFSIDDFSHEHLCVFNFHVKVYSTPLPKNSEKVLNSIIDCLNEARKEYLQVNDKDLKKKLWWQMIQLLPSSYNQMRTVQLNYEILRRMYFARKNHKLDEWKTFCQIILNDLPWFAEIIGEEK